MSSSVVKLGTHGGVEVARMARPRSGRLVRLHFGPQARPSGVQFGCHQAVVGIDRVVLASSQRHLVGGAGHPVGVLPGHALAIGSSLTQHRVEQIQLGRLDRLEERLDHGLFDARPIQVEALRLAIHLADAEQK